MNNNSKICLDKDRTSKKKKTKNDEKVINISLLNKKHKIGKKDLIKEDINNKTNKSNNPKNIEFLKDLTNNSYSLGTNNSFCVFKSINDILYLIYSDEDISIISYNIVDNKIINKIKNSHIKYIINFRHYLDINNNRDLLLSSDYNNLKLWDVNNFGCLLIINDINKKGFLFSTSFIYDNDQIFILTTNYIVGGISEPMKVYDMKGNKIKEINDPYQKNSALLIEVYYDIKLKKVYIIVGSTYCIKSYEFNENKIYNYYIDDNIDGENHINFTINNDKEIIKLIDANERGIIRIWDFHLKILLSKITTKNNLNSICLWDNDYLFLGTRNNFIILIDLKKGKIIKRMKGHNNRVSTIRKITHPIYGNCLISQGLELNNIKLWVIKNISNGK